tara:strand:- start:190 stop:639 length:450 start_codon:yes stop_codon:yes gene_type:complete
MQGFIVNDAEVTGINGSFDLTKKILLHEDNDPSTGMDVFSKAMPNSCYLSHLDIQADVTSGTPTKFTAFLTWDENGDDPCTGLAEGIKAQVGLTDTSLLSTSIFLGTYVTRPAGQTTSGKLYLHLKQNAAGGVITLKKARLHWVVRETV